MKMIGSVSILASLVASATAAALPAAAEYPANVNVEVVSGPPEWYRTVNNTKRDGLDKRANLGVYLCNDINWGGYCVHITAPPGVCVPLGIDLEDKVSAVGPDQGAYCRFFFDRNCAGASFEAGYPGYADLTTISANDQLISYWCKVN